MIKATFLWIGVGEWGGASRATVRCASSICLNIIPQGEGFVNAFLKNITQLHIVSAGANAFIEKGAEK